ncbi:MAG: rod shape-determining protein MreD, partial [Muribaculaceae bacterium]|nr:rod shape-determining protein MreD [Muribaculaceae bacterium]
MTKTFLSFLLLFVVLVLAQVTIFNHIWLFGLAMPLVFIYFIVSLPVTTPTNRMLTLGFMLGLTVDIFSNTAGLN